MKGLIIKDILMIKNNIKLLSIAFLVWLILSSTQNNDMTFVLPFLAIMIFISTFSYDDYNNWNAYAITLPNGRKNVVKSKYIASIILTVVIALICGVISYIFYKTKMLNLIQQLSGSLVGVIIVISLLYPIMFKYGSEKGRIITMLLVIGTVCISGLISKIINIPEKYINIFSNYEIAFLAVISIVSLIISYIISKKIYLKKEY